MSSEVIVNKSCGDIFDINVPIYSDTFIWIILDGVLFIVIISGNLVTLYVLHNSLQYTPLVSNRFVASLAISDTLVGCTLPYHMVFYIAPHLTTCKFTCLLRFVFILLATCASITNVVAIAVDRYLAILHPFRYETIMTTRVAHCVLGLGWLHALLVSTIPLYWNSWRDGVMCELGYILPKYYTAAIITPMFLVVWLIMGVIYWKIWREAMNQAYRLSHYSISKLRRSCLKVVLIIMGCFTVCWLPFLAVICAQSIGISTVPPAVYRTVLSLAFSSAAVNPLIYAWKNKEFKRTFGHMVRRRTASHSLQNDRSSIIDKQLQTSTPRNSLLQEMQQANAATATAPAQSNV